MNGKHWLAFAVGLGVGYLILPWAINQFMGMKKS